MPLPNFTLRQLIEVGAHLGHTTRRWNPKMKPFIFGARDNFHVLDLRQTKPMMRQALKMAHDVAARGGRMLFVGTKSQSRTLIREAANRCGQYYVNYRWLGGTITNWSTIAKSINHMKSLEKAMEEEASWRTKKEMLLMSRQHAKLERSLGGIREMSGLPDLLFVLDVNVDRIAVLEAVRKNIPVIGVLDSNSSPDGITYPIPGNDDSAKAIAFYLELISASVLEGLSRNIDVERSKTSGGDPGHSASLNFPVSEETKSTAPTAADSSSLVSPNPQISGEALPPESTPTTSLSSAESPTVQ